MSAVDFSALPRIESELAKLRTEVPQLVAEAVRGALAEHDADAVIDTAGLAKLLGCPSPTAAKRRSDRDPELRGLALSGGGGTRWTWRRSEVVALLASRRDALKRKGEQR